MTFRCDQKEQFKRILKKIKEVMVNEYNMRVNKFKIKIMLCDENESIGATLIAENSC